MKFHPTFSRHGRVGVNSALLIWLNENVHKIVDGFLEFLIYYNHRPMLHAEIKNLVGIGTLDAVFDVLDSNLVCILCKEIIDFLLQPASRHHFFVCRIRIRGLGKDLDLCHNAYNDSPIHREVQIKQFFHRCMHNIVTSRKKFSF